MCSGFPSTPHILYYVPASIFFQLQWLKRDSKYVLYCNALPCDVMLQLKSNPSNKEEMEAQTQLTKSDEIQRLAAQARDHFDSHDCVTAVAYLDPIIEVKQLCC